MQKRRARLHLGRKRVCARFSSGERWEKKGVGRAVQGEEKREREDSLAGGLLARGEAKSESIRRLSSRRREAIEPEALTFASDRPE